MAYMAHFMFLFLAVETVSAEKSGLSVTLEIAALLSAFIWPVVLLVVFLKYHKHIPSFVKGIVGRLSKFEIAGFSFELAKAKEFAPEWSEAKGALDLRQKAEAGQVTDSYMMTFRDQLMEEGSWDYAEVNLGNGEQWLTSRLFIMAIVFARMKGIRALVFLRQSGNLQKKFVCWAEPQKIRWALAKRSPWLEQAYGAADSLLYSQYMAKVVSNQGRLGTQFNPADPEPSISLIREFLTSVQSPAPPVPTESSEWVLLSQGTTYEHARWLSTVELEDILGADCHKSTVFSFYLSTGKTAEKLRALLSVPGNFVAVTAEDGQFEYLVDREVILEQMAGRLASHITE